MSGTYPSLQPSEQEFKEAMSRFPSGVTVIMTRDEEGQAIGMTASAFISVSLAPPLVLESVAKTAQMHSHLMREDRYSVSILAASQSQESNHFAGMKQDEFQPSIVDVEGLPAVGKSLARVACRIISRVDTGDHTLFIAQAQGIQLEDSDEPAFIYARRGYHKHEAIEN